MLLHSNTEACVMTMRYTGSEGPQGLDMQGVYIEGLNCWRPDPYYNLSASHVLINNVWWKINNALMDADKTLHNNCHIREWGGCLFICCTVGMAPGDIMYLDYGEGYTYGLLSPPTVERVLVRHHALPINFVPSPEMHDFFRVKNQSAAEWIQTFWQYSSVAACHLAYIARRVQICNAGYTADVEAQEVEKALQKLINSVELRG